MVISLVPTHGDVAPWVRGIARVELNRCPVTGSDAVWYINDVSFTMSCYSIVYMYVDIINMD